MDILGVIMCVVGVIGIFVAIWFFYLCRGRRRLEIPNNRISYNYSQFSLNMLRQPS